MHRTLEAPCALGDIGDKLASCPMSVSILSSKPEPHWALLSPPVFVDS